MHFRICDMYAHDTLQDTAVQPGSALPGRGLARRPEPGGAAAQAPAGEAETRERAAAAIAPPQPGVKVTLHSLVEALRDTPPSLAAAAQPAPLPAQADPVEEVATAEEARENGDAWAERWEAEQFRATSREHEQTRAPTAGGAASAPNRRARARRSPLPRGGGGGGALDASSLGRLLSSEALPRPTTHAGRCAACPPGGCDAFVSFGAGDVPSPSLPLSAQLALLSSRPGERCAACGCAAERHARGDARPPAAREPAARAAAEDRGGRPAEASRPRPAGGARAAAAARVAASAARRAASEAAVAAGVEEEELTVLHEDAARFGRETRRTATKQRSADAPPTPGARRRAAGVRVVRGLPPAVHLVHAKHRARPTSALLLLRLRLRGGRTRGVPEVGSAPGGGARGGGGCGCGARGFRGGGGGCGCGCCSCGGGGRVNSGGRVSEPRFLAGAGAAAGRGAGGGDCCVSSAGAADAPRQGEGAGGGGAVRESPGGVGGGAKNVLVPEGGEG